MPAAPDFDELSVQWSTAGKLLALAGVGAAAVHIAVPKDYLALFDSIAAAYHLDPALLRAIAWHESDFNPSVVSQPNTDGSRDYGLMQINDKNFAALGLNAQTALDPAASIQAAARLLAQIRQVNTTLPDTIAVYNAGPSQVAGRVGGPKYLADGKTYLNAAYVRAVWFNWWMIKISEWIT